MSLRAVIYARQSLDRTGEGAAVDRQVAACTELADARGWSLTGGPITDNDMSASSGKPRPGYARLLGMIRAGSIDRVIVWHLDRLTRRMLDLEEIVTLCESTGVRIATVTGDLDLSTDTGRMLARILASVAQAEVERKGSRQRLANVQRAEAGGMGWSVRPFGYDRRGGRIVTVTKEVRALRKAARDVLDGASVASAVRALNAAGLLTTRGKPFTVTTLRRALISPRYVGVVTYNGAVMGRGTWTAIFSQDMHDRLVAVLTDPKRQLHNGITVKYLLSGICLCGKCGKRMFATSADRGVRMVYRCMPSGHLQRGMSDVDNVVVSIIIRRLQLPDAAALLRPDVDIDALRAEAEDIRKRRDGIVAMIDDGLVSLAAGRARAETMTERLTRIDSDITAALGESPLSELIGAEDVAAAWDGMTLAGRREVIRTLMTVTVEPQGKGHAFDPASVRIDWIIE